MRDQLKKTEKPKTERIMDGDADEDELDKLKAMLPDVSQHATTKPKPCPNCGGYH